MTKTNSILGSAALTLLVVAAVLVGCGEHHDQAGAAKPHKHEHKPPHGGTPVVLGHEEYHVELVLDAVGGTLTGFVMDGELENFVRISAPSFVIRLNSPRPEKSLVFQAVPNLSTGETVGDTSQFEAHADWLKTTPTFDAVLPLLTVRTKTYTNVVFNFPKGNDHD